MSGRNIYKLNEEELRNMIKGALLEVINENRTDELGSSPVSMVLPSYVTKPFKNSLESGEGVAGVNFGIVKKRQNKQNLYKYCGLYKTVADQIMAIDEELERRYNLLVKNQQTDQAPQQRPPVNREAIRGAVNPVPVQRDNVIPKQNPVGINKTITNEGSVAGKFVKPVAKKVVTTTAKKAIPRAVRAGIGFSTLGVLMFGIPEKVSYAIQRCTKPETLTAEQMLFDYGDLVAWLQEDCAKLSQYPQLLGADVVQYSQGLLNGPQGEDLNITAGEVVKEVAEMAAYIGVSFIPVVGQIYDALSVAGAFISARAYADEEYLKQTESMYKYLENSIQEMNKLLKLSKSKSIAIVNQSNQNFRGGGSR